MSTENQNRENQNEKVDYQDLFNSLVKENEQKVQIHKKANVQKEATKGLKCRIFRIF